MEEEKTIKIITDQYGKKWFLHEDGTLTKMP